MNCNQEKDTETYSQHIMIACCANKCFKVLFYKSTKPEKDDILIIEKTEKSQTKTTSVMRHD